MVIENAATQNELLIKKWASAALTGIIIYIVLEVTVHLLPPHYSIRQAESDLAAGPYGIILNINFIVRSLLSGYIILAITRCARHSAGATMGLAFFAVWGVCSFLLAFFNADVTDSLESVRSTFHGQVHMMLAVISYICAPIGLLITSLSFQGINRLKILFMPALVVSAICVLSFIYLGQSGVYARNFGIFERICIGSILFWCALVALELRHTGSNHYSVK